MSLTKLELIHALHNDLGINKREANEVIEILLEEMRISLENGHDVKVSGFGTFQVRHKRERPGRNPKTGQDVPISARRVVTFRAGQKLLSKVQRYAGTIR